ncbi:hypothetical protein ACHAXR_000807 [Thalassiosira sp. AJA248-18]
MAPPSNRGYAAIASILALLYPIPVLSSNSNFANAPHARCPNGLKCHHGGQCATGDKDHTLDHPAMISADLPWLEEPLNVNGEHCINCHDGWGGVDCNRQYQQCDANDPNAPTCFNGSTCWKMGVSSSGVHEGTRYDYMCDCTDAEHNGVKYAGKFCQHVQEDDCDEEMFCTNGGKCKSLLGDDR